MSFSNSIVHRYNRWTKHNLKRDYIRHDIHSICEKQYDLDLKQNVTKRLIEYINKNSTDYDEYNRNRDSDDSTDSEDKFDQMPKFYFRLSDAIKIASFLRYSLCEQSLYYPYGK